MSPIQNPGHATKGRMQRCKHMGTRPPVGTSSSLDCGDAQRGKTDEHCMLMYAEKHLRPRARAPACSSCRPRPGTARNELTIAADMLSDSWRAAKCEARSVPRTAPPVWAARGAPGPGTRERKHLVARLPDLLRVRGREARDRTIEHRILQTWRAGARACFTAWRVAVTSASTKSAMVIWEPGRSFSVHGHCARRGAAPGIPQPRNNYGLRASSGQGAAPRALLPGPAGAKQGGPVTIGAARRPRSAAARRTRAVGPRADRTARVDLPTPRPCATPSRHRARLRCKESAVPHRRWCQRWHLWHDRGAAASCSAGGAGRALCE